MSKELEQYLAPGTDIPWESAAAFFVATREATIIKTAAGVTKQDITDAKEKGLLSGIRSSVAADVAGATRTARQRGQSVGKNVGALGGAGLGLLAGRKGGVAGKLGGSAIGALLGRSVGKSVGEEVDRARTISRYNRAATKKAEIEKRGSVARVRHLWKMAQGLSSGMENVEGAGAGATNASPMDEAALQELLAQQEPMVPEEPNVVEPSGAPTPEDLEYERAMAQLEEDMALDEAAGQNEAEHYRQIAEESQAQLQQMEQALAEAQQAAQMAQQQAGMSQQQADAASQQLQGQAQADAQEKEQLNEESLAARDTIMKMRQAMQAYRENLQQLALQDPIAQAGPSPEEQGMEVPEPLSGESAKQMQEAQQAQQEADMQTSQAEQAAAEDQAVLDEQAAAEEEAAAQEQAAADEQAAAEEATKTSMVRALWREKRASSLKTRALGAALGAAGGAGLQALSDRPGPGGMSEKERKLRGQLAEMEKKENPTALEKHKMTITRALADTAKTNREHKGSSLALGALTGAAAGAALAPTARRMAGRIIGR